MRSGRGCFSAHDYAIFWDWLYSQSAWLHVVTRIAWIGASFTSLRSISACASAGSPGAFGEEWQVHAAGFYHIQTYDRAAN